MNNYNKSLIRKSQDYFKNNYGVELSEDEATLSLDSLANLFKFYKTRKKNEQR